MWFIALWNQNSPYSRWSKENNQELSYCHVIFQIYGIPNTTQHFKGWSATDSDGR